MTKIISVHSFRGGTGKSNLSANLATAMGQLGLKVAVFDTDLASPGVHVLFQFTPQTGDFTLNDHLQGDQPIERCCHRLSIASVKQRGGQVYLVPASMDSDRIARLLREGYQVEKLNDAFFALAEKKSLDVIIVDTHPGINEETLLSTAIADALIMVMRPDSQDYLGTAVALEVAQRLEVPDARLVVNKLPAHFNAEQVRQRVLEAYDIPLGALLPLSEELLSIASGSLAVVECPDHPWSQGVRQLAAELSLDAVA